MPGTCCFSLFMVLFPIKGNVYMKLLPHHRTMWKHKPPDVSETMSKRAQVYVLVSFTKDQKGYRRKLIGQCVGVRFYSYQF